jgi:hypothetical protein
MSPSWNIGDAVNQDLSFPLSLPNLI